MRLAPLLSFTLLAMLGSAVPAFAVAGGTSVDFATVNFTVSTTACTGTLIAPDRILTAAHCVDGEDPDGSYVIVGVDAHDIPSVPESAHYAIEGYSQAPGYTLAFPFAHRRPQNATAVDDVAVIVLKQAVQNIQPLRIAGPGDAALEQPGKPVRVLGYGLLAARPNMPFRLPPALQQGGQTLISRGDCLKAYPHAVEKTTDICAQDLNTHHPVIEPCAGDSGGPLLADTPAGPVQLGVTSWGAEVKDNPCGKARLPSVWMRVSAFHDFITAANPTLAPHTSARKASLQHPNRHTYTCVPPTFGGSPAHVSYRWGAANFKGQLIPELSHPITPIKGATKRSFTTGRAATRGKKVACEVRAANAGGHWTVYSPSVAG